ncbi:hypothetical protein V2J09_004420 [Rumex salicifolius]
MTKKSLLTVCSVEKESQPTYELDQEKALQALNELDQQFDSLLTKPVPKPKIQASKLPDTLRDQMKGEEPVFSGPSLAYGAFVLFMFTIFYNIMFYAVIKPSIDIS